MAARVNDGVFGKVFEILNSETKSPELFVEPLSDKTESFKTALKTFYDNAEKVSGPSSKKKCLAKLLVSGFDDEQIWQQIELHNENALAHFRQSLAPADDDDDDPPDIDDPEDLDDEGCFDDEEDDPQCMDIKRAIDDEGKSDIDDEDGNLFNEPFAFDDDSDGSVNGFGETLQFDGDSDSPPEDGDRDIPDEVAETSPADIKPSVGQLSRPTIALTHRRYKSKEDSKFFKMCDYEPVQRTLDTQEEKGATLFASREEEDAVERLMAGDDDVTEPSEGEKGVMYDDFYDPPESSGDEDDNDLLAEEEGDEEDFDDPTQEGNETDAENAEDDEVNADEPSSDIKVIPKTPFELEQEKVKKKISDYEDKMLQAQEWQLTGEVAATDRPMNSLLYQETDFDVNAKPAIIEDKNLYEKTENMIKMAIKNKAFNDGERKYKTTEELVARKKEIVIDQNKSKKGLAQVYEEEYLKKQSKGEEEGENPKHVEIRKLMDSLFPELHALFAHIPKPPVPEIKIVRNLPAITVEEVAPTGVSDANLLAPEEVKRKTGLVKGDTERTDTDRKRERRKKKEQQKSKYKKLEEFVKKNPDSAKAKQFEKQDALRKVKQHRNTKIAQVGTDKVKSSKDFFARLQDKVNTASAQKNFPKSKTKK